MKDVIRTRGEPFPKSKIRVESSSVAISPDKQVKN